MIKSTGRCCKNWQYSLQHTLLCICLHITLLSFCDHVIVALDNFFCVCMICVCVCTCVCFKVCFFKFGHHSVFLFVSVWFCVTFRNTQTKEHIRIDIDTHKSIHMYISPSRFTYTHINTNITKFYIYVI